MRPSVTDLSTPLPRGEAAMTDQTNVQTTDGGDNAAVPATPGRRMSTIDLPLSQLEEAAWNPNRMPAPLLAKLRRSISEFGVVENLVARPHPDKADCFEV